MLVDEELEGQLVVILDVVQLVSQHLGALLQEHRGLLKLIQLGPVALAHEVVDFDLQISTAVRGGGLTVILLRAAGILCGRLQIVLFLVRVRRKKLENIAGRTVIRLLILDTLLAESATPPAIAIVIAVCSPLLVWDWVGGCAHSAYYSLLLCLLLLIPAPALGPHPHLPLQVRGRVLAGSYWGS